MNAAIWLTFRTARFTQKASSSKSGRRTASRINQQITITPMMLVGTPTQDSRDIINAAVKCLDKIWKDGHRYQKAGIMLGDFFSQGVAQLNLFDENAPRAGSERLMEVLDYLNGKDGKGTLYFAGQGIQQQWQMKRDMLSPRYTTRYSDLIKVR
ncbi:DUF4113 domain-containing protein [Enterobacter asburiae]|uniref:DUF4113 domain-containing protein n=1 Tax=Enterobacter asburiae TaxID=61645 RepID=UPI002A81771D|nr:DUF4113 domain-containing protein [Enterobacter asburiae]